MHLLHSFTDIFLCWQVIAIEQPLLSVATAKMHVSTVDLKVHGQNFEVYFVKTPIKVIQNCGSHNFVALSNGTWKKAPVYNIWVTAAETTKLLFKGNSWVTSTNLENETNIVHKYCKLTERVLPIWMYLHEHYNCVLLWMFSNIKSALTCSFKWVMVSTDTDQHKDFWIVLVTPLAKWGH